MCSRSGIKRLPGKLLLLCVLVLVVGVTSCATDKDMNYLNDQVIALNRRVAKLEEGTDNRLSTIRTSQGDVRVEMDQLRSEMQKLSGRLEAGRGLLVLELLQPRRIQLVVEPAHARERLV